MFNTIRMELHRMFHTKSFYITLAANVILIAFLYIIMAPSINDGFAAAQPDAATSISQSGGGWKVEMVLDNRSAPNPVNVCAAYMGLCILFVATFMALFVGRFYKDGFCKNVLSSSGHRFTFPIAQSVCTVVYVAINITLAGTVSLAFAKLLVHSFTFAYLNVFCLNLLGQFLLLCAVGSFSAFLTSSTRSTVPAIVYVLLISTNIMSTFTGFLDSHLSDWMNKEVMIEDFLPSLYFGNRFLLDVSESAKNGSMLLHAALLSMAFLVIYNVAGTVLLTRRDVK